MTLTAVPKDAAGNVLKGRAAGWSSSDPAVVRVVTTQEPTGEPTAFATALGIGEVTITATVEGKTGEARITATVLPEQSWVKVWPDTSRIPVGARRGLIVRRLAGQNRDPLTLTSGLTWESSDPRVARVDDTGGVTAVGEGHATITAVLPKRRIDAEVFVFRYPAPLEFASVAVGEAHTCAVTGEGVPYCWGHNDQRQLGSDVLMDRCGKYSTSGGGIIAEFFRCSEVPVPVATTLRLASLSAAGNMTCGLTSSGAAYCWGNNRTGVSEIKGGIAFRMLDAGGTSACGVSTSGVAYCWNGDPFASPQPVAEGHAWRTISIGSTIAGPTYCGITTDSVAYCWGASSLPPERVVGDLRLSQIETAAGGRICALTGDGTAYCWGEPPDRPPAPTSQAPTLVPGGLRFRSLHAGPYACGIDDAGAVHCWGGMPLTGYPLLQTPARQLPEFPVRTVAFTYSHSCAIDTPGILYCWDGRGFGGTSPFWGFYRPRLVGSSTPVRVAGQ